MITTHALKRIEERHISIDIEMVEYLCQKYKSQDTAVFLGEILFLGDMNYVILIIRGGNAITIEFRRKSQSIDEKSLNVMRVEKYPCLFD